MGQEEISQSKVKNNIIILLIIIIILMNHS